MRILLDECVPRGLRRSLPGHDVATVPELGWSGKKNGELMQFIAAEAFDIFLTVDQNLQFQQKLESAALAVVVLSAPSNQLRTWRHLRFGCSPRCRPSTQVISFRFEPIVLS
jgi:hypothetical protein